MKKPLFRKKSNRDPLKWYCTFSLVMLGLLGIIFLAGHGAMLNRYFWHDVRDTGMDFFHSIEYVQGRAPYEQFSTLYPPLANLLFYGFFRMIPPEVYQNWTMDFSESILMRGTDADLRTWQAPMVLFIAFVLLCTWMIVTLAVWMLHKNTSYAWANCAAFCVMVSPGIIYALERGNIIVLCVPLSLFFVCFRNSENRFIRELALIALAVAAGIKLYPALFGILLLRDKKYKEAARTVVYGILSVILPLFLLKEGLRGLPLWLQAITRVGTRTTQSAAWNGTDLPGILQHVMLAVQQWTGTEGTPARIAAAGLIGAVVLAVCALLMKKDWQSCTALVLAMVLYQYQPDYIFSMMAIPMLLFMAQEQRLAKHNAVPFALLMLLTVNLPVFRMQDDKYTDPLVRQILLVLLLVWCIAAACSEIAKMCRKSTVK